MRIARVITRLNIGGPAIHAILLTEGLDNDKFESLMIIGTPDRQEGDMLSLAKNKNLAICHIPELKREIGLHDIAAFWKLFRYFKCTRPDIVHTHTAKAGALGRLAAFLAGVPIRVHTFHGHIFDGYFNPRKARAFLCIERFLGRLTDKVVVVSEKIRDEIVDKLKVVKEEKCAVIPLGLELDKFLECESKQGEFRKTIGVSEGILLVGIVGRLVPIKNHGMFLEIVKRMEALNRDLQIKFVVIGDGESKGSIKEKVKELGLEGIVIFTGWVKDLPAAYLGLDVVVLTSLNEGTPLSLIEAMASGKPVVATDVGGVGDVVLDGETGFLVDPGDVNGFVNKLSELIKDKKKRSMFGSRGRELAIKKYSKERLIRDVENLYEECMAEKLCHSRRERN